MGINKVQYGNTTLIDLTSDTVTADKLMQGYTAHDRTGALITGTATGGGQPNLQSKTKTYTPTTSQQTESVSADSGYDGLDTVSITVNAMPTGTAGTPTITVGALARGERKISASVTNTAGYIDDGTLDANSVYLSAVEFVTGSKTITENGTSDVTTYESVVVNVPSTQPTIQSLTVTPTTSQQTFNASGVDGYKPVTVNAMPSGTAGTPTATKGAVSNHSVSVTPSVTNQTGYITGSTKTGTTVTVSASELVSGSETKTENGTYDVTNLASLVVNVPSGSSKNTQVVQGTTRTTSSTLTAIGAEMTVSKTGTYDVYWSAFRSSTSSSYTYGTQLYVNGTAYGTQNTTWSNHVQNNHLTGVSLTANQKIRVYGRNSRGSSYYIYAPTLVIVEA